MVRAVKQNISKSAYFLFSLIALTIFIGTVWYVWQDIEKETSRRLDVMIKDMAVSNVNLVEGVVSGYLDELAHVQHILKVERNQQLVEETFHYIKKQDSTIRDIEIVDRDKFLLLNQSSLFEGGGYLHFLQEVDSVQGLYLCMKIDLLGLHKKISERKDLLHAYVTIVAEGRYVFHPDEKLLGKIVLEAEGQQKKGELKEVYSDYLKMNVYKYFEPFDVGGQQWIFSANILKLDLQEYMQRRGKGFVWILVSALLSFLLIVALGLFRWRREFAQRKNVEQQNLELALKNEQQKQAAVSRELETLKSGLNPHFLFNAMSSLKILVSKKPDLAKQFAVKLSSVYRYMLKHEKADLVRLKYELAFVEDYVQLQKIRFGEKLNVVLKLDNALLERKVPPMSVQLLVENAIKHTVISESQPLSILISSGSRRIIVSNNYSPRLSEVENTGKGIENLERRYSLLTKETCAFYIKEDCYIAEIPLLD